MKPWNKKPGKAAVAGAGISGEPARQNLLEKTLQKLASNTHVDRIGAWLQPSETETKPPANGSVPKGFRGIVWDRQSETLPVEWQHLSPEALLPQEVLASGQIVEQALEHGALPMIGPLVELRRAMWVPVERQGRLRGILLAGTRSKHGKLPVEALQAAASDIQLAIELEEEHHSARDGRLDLLLARKTLHALVDLQKVEDALAGLVDDCTSRPLGDGGMGIRFAAIGHCQEERCNPTGVSRTIFHWASGDPEWISALRKNSVAPIWSKAIETRCLTIEELPAISGLGETLQIVAIPLETAKKLLGVFVVGLASVATSPSNLQRVEFRASLAAAALEAWSRGQVVARQSDARNEITRTSVEAAFLDAKATASASADPSLLLDRLGFNEEENAQHDARAATELKSILQWLDEGVILFDVHDNVRALNARFLHLTGLDTTSDGAELTSLENLIAKLSPSVADSWSFAQRWRNLARGIDSGIREEELEFVRPSARIVQRQSRPITDSRGRRLGRVEIYRDLSTPLGFQSKLLHTEKLAALGQLITGVAHELNNPLTSILGYSQRLLQKEHSGGSDRELRHIFEEAERATAILGQLRWNAHESKLEMRTIAINQVVLRAVEVQQASLVQERIHLEMDLDPSWPLVHGDAGQLQQVLMNLMGNARQALDQTAKGGKIRVRTKQIGDQRVLLEVADDGPGIPAETLGRIFDPFFTTKPAGVGTGLGLAIVLGIVREHGGHVNVASPPSGGAIFSIALRAASSVPQSPNVFTAKRTSITSRTWPGDAAAALLAAPAGLPKNANHILVVEDEPTVARLIADVLEDEGFQVDVQLDGREALQQTDRQTYDLVICDMKMPGLDGKSFYQALVQAGNPLSKRFLFVTGDLVAQHTQQFLEQHQLPHVAKPFRMEELKNCVRGLLARDFSGESGTRKVGKKIMDDAR